MDQGVEDTAGGNGDRGGSSTDVVEAVAVDGGDGGGQDLDHLIHRGLRLNDDEDDKNDNDFLQAFGLDQEDEESVGEGGGRKRRRTDEGHGEEAVVDVLPGNTGFKVVTGFKLFNAPPSKILDAVDQYSDVTDLAALLNLVSGHMAVQTEPGLQREWLGVAQAIMAKMSTPA